MGDRLSNKLRNYFPSVFKVREDGKMLPFAMFGFEIGSV